MSEATVDPWRRRVRGDLAPARQEEVEALEDLAAMVADDPAPDPLTLACLEALHRLSLGLPGVWVDEAAFRRATSQLFPGVRRLELMGLTASGLIETEFVTPGRWQRGVRVRLIRLTQEGAAEHFAWRGMQA